MREQLAYQPQDRHFRNSYHNRLKINRPIVPEGQLYPIQSTDNSLDIPTRRIATNWRVTFFPFIFNELAVCSVTSQ
jgi:hypothetical protein